MRNLIKLVAQDIELHKDVRERQLKFEAQLTKLVGAGRQMGLLPDRYKFPLETIDDLQGLNITCRDTDVAQNLIIHLV